jgi:hypothetical protein
MTRSTVGGSASTLSPEVGGEKKYSLTREELFALLRRAMSPADLWLWLRDQSEHVQEGPEDEGQN